MGSKKTLVIGWYGKGNLGDEAFKTSFKSLWPVADFEFRDSIPGDVNTEYQSVWVGGGSFLDSAVNKIDTVTIPIGFIGVGLGSYIHPVNVEALKRARIVVVRDEKSVDYAPEKSVVLVAPDLVFAQSNYYPCQNQSKRVLFIGNDFLSPSHKSAEWQNLAFHWFCQEFAKIADNMVEQDVSVHFVPMCVNPEIDDRRFNSQIITRMKSRAKVRWETTAINEIQLRENIAQSELVVTLRLHGAIFSSIANTPFLLLGSHDKMNGLMKDLGAGKLLDYYGFTSKLFNQALLDPTIKSDSQYPINAKERWQCIADIVARTFFL